MVTFNFTYDAGVTVQQVLGFEIAGRIWSSYLADPVTLNIHIGMSSSLPTNVIGGALPGILAGSSVFGFRDHLLQDVSSSDDQFNAGSVFPVIAFDRFINGINHRSYTNTSTLNITRANAKAVGMISGNNTALDGAIVMGNLANSQFSWNYDYTRSSTPGANSLDFLSVALHEIGHILGFISGVDKPGLFSSTVDVSQLSTYQAQVTERLNYASSLDMFRFNSSNQRDLSYGSTGGEKRFSLQADAQFATGKNTSFSGDGFQASHWKEQSTPLGIMDPAIAPRERVSISNLDLRAFDVIGWNLRNGLSASPFTTTSLTNFRNQAVQGLVQRIGRTTTWVNSNLRAVPTNLGSDRTLAVEAMIQSSGLYEWGTTGSGTTSTSGRRWMEIFNQMASNQEVYVNFSTVSNVSPNSEGSDPPSLNWGHNGSGKTSPGGRVWSENPTHTTDSSNDGILGVNAAVPLVSFDSSDTLNQANNRFVGAIANSSSIPSSLPTNAPWTPVSTKMTESPSVNVSTLATATGLRQQSLNFFSSGLNTLLGVENNPLAQSNLSVGLMGAIA